MSTANPQQAAINTAKYLYSVDNYEGTPELLEAIGRLRQLINEEFVAKNKSVSSQFIYNTLKAALPTTKSKEVI